MRRFLTLTLLATMLGALLPLAPATAQGADSCADALNEIFPSAYKVVIAPNQGGSGSQIVLGTDGPDHLDAGTGSNELDGGSGNDTLIGIEGDTFDGGSGRNEIVANAGSVFVFTIGPADDGKCDVSFSLTNGPASADVGFSVPLLLADGFEIGTYSYFQFTDPSGALIELDEDALETGSRIGEIPLMNTDTNPNQAIATHPGGTCE